MNWLAKGFQSFRSLLRRDAVECELDDEVRFHLEMQVEINIATGMNPEEARYAALRAFGGVDKAKEECRDARALAFLDTLFRDLRYASRLLTESPGFTAVLAISLALGIGGTAAIFSVVNGVLLKPLAYPEPEQLISVAHVAPGVQGIPFGEIPCAPSMYFTYREKNQTFQEFGLWSAGSATVTGMGDPERVQTVQVTYGTLQALGVQPSPGRWFSQADDTPGTPETVILTYGYWQKHFGGDASAVGRTINIDSRPRTIIGVMPQTFRFISTDAELILPHRFNRSEAILGRLNYQGVARLKPGVTVKQAKSDVERMLAVWLESWPAPPGFDRQFFVSARIAPRLQPLKESLVGNISEVLWLLMGAIGLVLLVACANVANLLLVRAESRHREMAIRAALGASWGRIARSMLVESLLFALLGGAVGLALAYAGLRLVVAIAPAAGPVPLPRLSEIGIDPLVLLFTVAISLLTGMLLSLGPVLKYREPQLATALRAGGRDSSETRERHLARTTLVVAQMALALVLLVGSGLMIRTFQALRKVQPGFREPGSVQIFRITIPEGQIKEPDHVVQVQQQILEKLAAIHGVQSAAFGASAPMDGSLGWIDPVFAQDKTYPPGQMPPLRTMRFTAPGYFQTLGTPLIVGRDFTWNDLYDHHYVAIISENTAREMWGQPDAALGKRLRTTGDDRDPWREIVGVVGDVHDGELHIDAPKTIYWPVLDPNFWGPDFSGRSVTFLIRSDRTATESFLAEIRQAVWSVNDGLPLMSVRTLDEVYRQSMAWTSFTLVVLAIAGGMALLLGVVGIYGVISYTVAQRTHEIGIRGALGATRADILKLIMLQGMEFTIAGVAVGLLASIALTRFLAKFIFGVSPTDPFTYVAVSIVLIAVAGVASYVPARRAARVDPMQALRAE